MSAGDRLERCFRSILGGIRKSRALESGIGRMAALDVSVHGEFGIRGTLVRGRQLFEFQIAAGKHFNYPWIKTLPCLALHYGDGLLERHRLTILPIRCQGIEAVH